MTTTATSNQPTHHASLVPSFLAAATAGALGVALWALRRRRCTWMMMPITKSLPKASMERDTSAIRPGANVTEEVASDAPSNSDGDRTVVKEPVYNNSMAAQNENKPKIADARKEDSPSSMSHVKEKCHHSDDAHNIAKTSSVHQPPMVTRAANSQRQPLQAVAVPKTALRCRAKVNTATKPRPRVRNSLLPSEIRNRLEQAKQQQQQHLQQDDDDKLVDSTTTATSDRSSQNISVPNVSSSLVRKQQPRVRNSLLPAHIRKTIQQQAGTSTPADKENDEAILPPSNSRSMALTSSKQPKARPIVTAQPASGSMTASTKRRLPKKLSPTRRSVFEQNKNTNTNINDGNNKRRVIKVRPSLLPTELRLNLSL